jgi:hypothetical protein
MTKIVDHTRRRAEIAEVTVRVIRRIWIERKYAARPPCVGRALHRLKSRSILHPVISVIRDVSSTIHITERAFAQKRLSLCFLPTNPSTS